MPLLLLFPLPSFFPAPPPLVENVAEIFRLNLAANSANISPLNLPTKYSHNGKRDYTRLHYFHNATCVVTLTPTATGTPLNPETVT